MNWIKKVKFEIRKRKLYDSFCNFQIRYKKILKEFPKWNNFSLNNIKEHLNTLNSVKFDNPIFKHHLQYLSELEQREVYKLIPFSIHIYVRIHAILKGMDSRLVYIKEIAKNIDQADLIIYVIKDMIKQEEIKAKYFEKSQAIFFKDMLKEGDIMKLMIKYRDKR